MTNGGCLAPESIAALTAGTVAILGAVTGAWIKLVQVHRAVNGNLAEAKRDLRELREKLRAMARLNAELRHKGRPATGSS